MSVPLRLRSRPRRRSFLPSTTPLRQARPSVHLPPSVPVSARNGMYRKNDYRSAQCGDMAVLFNADRTAWTYSMLRKVNTSYIEYIFGNGLPLADRDQKRSLVAIGCQWLGGCNNGMGFRCFEILSLSLSLGLGSGLRVLAHHSPLERSRKPVR